MDCSIITLQAIYWGQACTAGLQTSRYAAKCVVLAEEGSAKPYTRHPPAIRRLLLAHYGRAGENKGYIYLSFSGMCNRNNNNYQKQ